MEQEEEKEEVEKKKKNKKKDKNIITIGNKVGKNDGSGEKGNKKKKKAVTSQKSCWKMDSGPYFSEKAITYGGMDNQEAGLLLSVRYLPIIILDRIIDIVNPSGIDNPFFLMSLF